MNNIKTEICKKWEEKGYCEYGEKCLFAHGLTELKSKRRNKNYKTKKCIAYLNGFCPYVI
jgi:butyrate response factor